mgnify:CR=1 FL=1
MSISENVGGMSRYLGGLRTGNGYNDLKKNVADTLERIPVVGERMIDRIKRTKNSIKQLFIPGMLFENMGITYLGPVDGHNIQALCKVFKEAQKLDHAVLVHVLTKKGKGYEPAEKNPAAFHGVSPFDIKTGRPVAEKKYPTYTDVFSKKCVKLGETHPELVAVTAAMPDGTGWRLLEKIPGPFLRCGYCRSPCCDQCCRHGSSRAAAGGSSFILLFYREVMTRFYMMSVSRTCRLSLQWTGRDW